VLDSKGRASLINNIAESLAQCTDKNVVCRVLNVLANVDNDFGRKLAEKIKL
jgi:catalase